MPFKLNHRQSIRTAPTHTHTQTQAEEKCALIYLNNLKMFRQKRNKQTKKGEGGLIAAVSSQVCVVLR